jgi:hypothetical protein
MSIREFARGDAVSSLLLRLPRICVGRLTPRQDAAPCWCLSPACRGVAVSGWHSENQELVVSPSRRRTRNAWSQRGLACPAVVLSQARGSQGFPDLHLWDVANQHFRFQQPPVLPAERVGIAGSDWFDQIWVDVIDWLPAHRVKTNGCAEQSNCLFRVPAVGRDLNKPRQTAGRNGCDASLLE